MDKQLPVSVWPEWKIIEKIGEGSFGKVYKAQRSEKDTTFYSAIKVITIPSSQSELSSVRSESGSDQSARAYFQGLVEECIQEVSTMEYFRGNSHVVSVEDYKVVEYLDDIGWDIYIRMECLTSFMDYCSEKQMDEEEVIRLGIDLCKALEYCQMQNIIHRDIKPENIFVSRFGEFKLGDFGIARELERSMSGFSKKGTYSYMAPEMYRGEQYDCRVDIYSLGIVLYKLRNHNRLPFLNLEKQLITYRDKENALARRVSGEPLAPPVDAGKDLAEVILKACAYNPSDRYQNAGEFRRALEGVRGGRTGRLSENANDPGTASGASDRYSSDILDVSGEKTQRCIPSQLVKRETENSRKYTAVQRETDQKRAVHRDTPQKQITPSRSILQKRVPSRQDNIRNTPQTSRNKKKKESGSLPLLIAVIVMGIAVCIVSAIFIRLLLDDSSYYEEVWEPAGTAFDMDEEKQELYQELQVIKEQATYIEDNLNYFDGTPEEGILWYRDEQNELIKVLVYPVLSEDGYYEEYYYWNGELFFAYIWANGNIISGLADGEVKADYYYYKNGELIRWIDQNNICHDGETDNEEYVTRGATYWDRSVSYKEGFS